MSLFFLSRRGALCLGASLGVAHPTSEKKNKVALIDHRNVGNAAEPDRLVCVAVDRDQHVGANVRQSDMGCKRCSRDVREGGDVEQILPA